MKIAVILCVLAVAVLTLGWTAEHYHARAEEWRGTAQRSQQREREQAAVIAEMQTSQQQLAALDAKYTKELAGAKQTIADLQRDVTDGTKRLRVKARCPVVQANSAIASASVDDAVSARLTDTAQQDYFIIRERIEIARQQIAGLQQYITEQCIRDR